MKPATTAILSVSMAVAGLFACARHADAPPADSSAPAATAELSAALPFIENDYTTALNRAREAKLPLFVEVWAPW